MGKHSKNPSCNPILTYQEKQKLSNYGTISMRISSDSVKDFNNCNICLKDCNEPVCCTNGHIYCKGCIYESILQQKNDIKNNLKNYEMQCKKEQFMIDNNSNDIQNSQIEQFIKMESSILPSNEKLISTSKELVISNNISKRIDRDSLNVYNDQGIKLSTSEARDIKDKHMPSFWLPSEAPKAVITKLTKPNENIFCPQSKHIIRLKQLIPIKWTMVTTTENDMRGVKSKQDGRFMCPSCTKSFINGSSFSHIRSCGHVLCSLCIKSFVVPEKRCNECGTITTPDEIVQIDSGGSGFSGGAQSVMTKVETPAFRGC